MEIDSLKKEFQRFFSGEPQIFRAPGRVNLIGEHTDYNAGYVLPLAVDRVVAFAGRPRGDQQVRLWSSHFQQYAEFSLAGLPASWSCARPPRSETTTT